MLLVVAMVGTAGILVSGTNGAIPAARPCSAVVALIFALGGKLHVGTIDHPATITSINTATSNTSIAQPQQQKRSRMHLGIPQQGCFELLLLLALARSSLAILARSFAILLRSSLAVLARSLAILARSLLAIRAVLVLLFMLLLLLCILITISACLVLCRPSPNPPAGTPLLETYAA